MKFENFVFVYIQKKECSLLMPHYLDGLYSGHLANVNLTERETIAAIEIYRMRTEQLERLKPSPAFPDMVERFAMARL